MCEPFFPTTIASSPSNSTLLEMLGNFIISSVPIIADGGFKNNNGLFGIGLFSSIAWAA